MNIVKTAVVETGGAVIADGDEIELEIELTDEELKAIGSDHIANEVAKRARDSALAFMRRNRLPVDSVPSEFVEERAAAAAKLFLENLDWDGEPLNEQLGAAIREAFVTRLIERYWDDLNKTTPTHGQRRDEFLTQFVTTTRHVMFKYVWNQPGGIKVKDTN